jgi:hypothetical protein
MRGPLAGRRHTRWPAAVRERGGVAPLVVLGGWSMPTSATRTTRSPSRVWPVGIGSLPKAGLVSFARSLKPKNHPLARIELDAAACSAYRCSPHCWGAGVTDSRRGWTTTTGPTAAGGARPATAHGREARPLTHRCRSPGTVRSCIARGTDMRCSSVTRYRLSPTCRRQSSTTERTPPRLAPTGLRSYSRRR